MLQTRLNRSLTENAVSLNIWLEKITFYFYLYKFLFLCFFKCDLCTYIACKIIKYFTKSPHTTKIENQ